jgi:hypothetical protein
MRPHTVSYWAVDFPRLFDVVQLRLHIMRKVLKDELDCKVCGAIIILSSWAVGRARPTAPLKSMQI